MFQIAMTTLLLLTSPFALGADKAGPKADAKKDEKTADKPKGNQKMFALFETSMGNFKARLFPEESPITVENFVGLAEGTKEWTDKGKKEKKPLYNGTIFHRVIPGFMLQGGDPDGNGTGGPGFTIKDEFNPKLKHDRKGLLSMAKTAAPNSAGSQFFVTVAPTDWLDGKHAIFGEVIEGYDVVEKISKVKTAPGDRPVTPVVIKSIKIERK